MKKQSTGSSHPLDQRGANIEKQIIAEHAHFHQAPALPSASQAALPPLTTILSGPDAAREFGVLVQVLLLKFYKEPIGRAGRAKREKFELEPATPEARRKALILADDDTHQPFLALPLWPASADRFSIEENNATCTLVSRLNLISTALTHALIVLPFTIPNRESSALWKSLEIVIPFRLTIAGPAEIEQWLRACPPLLARYYPQEAAKLAPPQKSSGGFYPAYSGRPMSELAARFLKADLPNHRDLRQIGLPPRLTQEQGESGGVPLKDIFVAQTFKPPGQDAAHAKSLAALLALDGPKVLLGDPGSGKTTVLHFLALLYAGEATLADAPATARLVPLFLSLRDVAKHLDERPTLVEAFVHAGTQLNLRPDEAHPWLFESLLEMGEAVVLLDGLDEAGGPAARERLCRLIERFHLDYPACPLWVTSRFVGYGGKAQFNDPFTRFDVAPFAPEQRDAFIRNWFKLRFPNQAVEAHRHSDSLMAAIRRAHVDVQQLAANPLLLNLMALIHHGRRHLPQKRGELYHECVEMLLHRWEHDRLDAPTALEKLSPPIGLGEARNYLATIALEAQTATENSSGEVDPSPAAKARDATARGDLAEPWLRRRLEELRARRLAGCDLKELSADRRQPTLDQSRSDMQVFLDYIRDRTGLLLWRGDETYAFAHLSLMEFLAAYKLAEDRERSFAVQRATVFAKVGLPTWREPLLLLLYLLSESPAGDEAFTDALVPAAEKREREQKRPASEVWHLLGMAVRDELPFAPHQESLILGKLLTEWVANPVFAARVFHILEDIAIFAEGPRERLRPLLHERWQAADLPSALAVLHLRVRLLGWPKEVPEEHERLAHALRQRLSAAPAGDALALFCRAAELLADAGPDTVAAQAEGKQCVEFVRTRLVEWAASKLPAKERAQAGVALGKLGDPRSGVGLDEPTGLPKIDWVELPQGEFIRGEDKEPAKIEKPFRLSKYPITWQQYQAFVEDQGYQQEDLWKDGKDALGMRDWWKENKDKGPENYDAVFQTPNHPRVGVCWYEATAFCRWLTERLRAIPALTTGKDGASLLRLLPSEEIRLPHENEWEWAARWNKDTGQADARNYPWRDYDAIADLAARCNWDMTGLGHTSAVGLFPKGEADCGALDLSGNVWEWCDNRYDEKTENARVMRGGSWVFNDPASLSCSFRYYDGAPDYRDYYVGFRVVCVGGSAR